MFPKSSLKYMNRDPNYRFSLPQTDDWLIGCREINLAPSTHVPVVDSKLRQKVTLKKKITAS